MAHFNALGPAPKPLLLLPARSLAAALLLLLLQWWCTLRRPM